MHMICNITLSFFGVDISEVMSGWQEQHQVGRDINTARHSSARFHQIVIEIFRKLGV
jgi:hypothetical protein